MKISALLIGLIVGLSSPVSAQDADEINAVIYKLTTGVDHQDKSMILEAFREDASLFATNPAGDDLVILSAEEFAELHGSKRFGGQQRDVVIDYIDITDDLVAVAKVLATSDQVHYTYYLGLTRVDGKWLVQTFLQRSKKAR